MRFESSYSSVLGVVKNKQEHFNVIQGGHLRNAVSSRGLGDKIRKMQREEFFKQCTHLVLF